MPAAANSRRRSRWASARPKTNDLADEVVGHELERAAAVARRATRRRPSGRAARPSPASGRRRCRRARSRRRASSRRAAGEALLLGPGKAEEAAQRAPCRARRTASARPAPCRSAGRRLVNAPSPSSAASASILPRSAAMTIGTGSAGGALELEAAGPALARQHRAQRLDGARASRLSGRSNGISFQRSTITFDDEPSPSTKRPPEASASAAACWASTAVPRVNGLTTPVAEPHAPRVRGGEHERREPVGPGGLARSTGRRSRRPRRGGRARGGRSAGTPENGSVRPQRWSGTRGQPTSARPVASP